MIFKTIVHLVGFLFIVVIAGARNHEPEISNSFFVFLWSDIPHVLMAFAIIRMQPNQHNFYYGKYKLKVKVTLVQALRLCTVRTAHSWSRGITLLFHDHSTRRGWGVSVTPRPFFTPGKDPVAIAQEVGWAPGPVWTGAENSPPLGFDSRTTQPVASHYTDWATQPIWQI
jgi:hypothetical protein